MKLSEILTEARDGALINEVSVEDASKVIANASGKLTFNSTLFQRKYFPDNGDELIRSANGSKQTNITKLSEVIRNHEGLEMVVHIGRIFYEGLIEIDV